LPEQRDPSVAKCGKCREALFSGAPLEVTGNRASDPGASDASLLTDLAINDFEYGDDAQGKVVPLAAHIRKETALYAKVVQSSGIKPE